MSELKLTKEDFEEIESVVTKRLRNKKKKLEKIITTESKIASKEIQPTAEQKKMVSSKAKVESQIKELEDIKRTLHKECLRVLDKHKQIVKGLKTGEANVDNTVKRTLGVVADALLVNLLQNEYNVKNLLGNEERIGLEAIMLPIKNLFNPPADQLVYSRARECFITLFESFVKGSNDIIPGTDATYNKLLSDIQSIPEDVKQATYRLDAEETAAEEAPQAQEYYEEEKVEVVPQQTQAVGATWNEVDQEDEEVDHAPNAQHRQEEEEEKPTVEELVEQDVQKDMVRGKRSFLKEKTFIDEDGFVHAKPHARNEFEHNMLRGRGRRGKKGRHGDTDRLKVRGGKGPRGMRGRGRGGKYHHDKHDVDEAGRKTKTAHGRRPHWSKGEVRVDQPAAPSAPAE